jgi:hypothetical protein
VNDATDRQVGGAGPRRASAPVTETVAPEDAGSAIDLFWIPLGAGGHVVRLNGIAYEAMKAFVQRRPRARLFHAALEVTGRSGRFVIEVTPIPDDRGGDRGVVAAGPVGVRWLGRFRLFRYEVRRWRGGRIPDLEWAVSGPVRVSSDPAATERLLEAAPSVPTPVWGRDELRTGDMWNSNSVVSWLLERAGLDASRLHPPSAGRAPGWDAGVIVARRTNDR